MPPGENTSSTPRLQKAVEIEQDIKQFAKKSLVGYGGILVSVFLLFITIVAVTTDISISLDSLKELSTEFFLLFFCSYAAYICCSDSGTKSGKSSQIYRDTLAKFEETYQNIVNNNIHCILGDFCKEYIASELKNAKTRYLVSAGIDYDDYIREYSSLEDAQINELSGLSTAQKKALMSANAVKPLKLSPEQITRHGTSNFRHSPLLISPELIKGVRYLAKFITSLLIVIGMSYMVFNNMTDTTWAAFALVCVKSGSVLYNCFSGYKCGYENIVIHSVNYMNEQISLMQQAIAFAAERKNHVTDQYICTDKDGAGEYNSAG
jgi:hypothetical protein